MNNLLRLIPDHDKHLIDGLSIATLLGSLVNVLPHIAAGLTLVWTAIRIWETRTVQGWLGKRPKDAAGDE